MFPANTQALKWEVTFSCQLKCLQPGSRFWLEKIVLDYFFTTFYKAVDHFICKQKCDHISSVSSSDFAVISEVTLISVTNALTSDVYMTTASFAFGYRY